MTYRDSGYFGGDSWSGSRGSPVFGPDKAENRDRYHNSVADDLDDDALREAERIVKDRWRKEGRKYRHGYHDCHSYIDEVLNEYYNLMRANGHDGTGGGDDGDDGDDGGGKKGS